jgi:hypothetical protein
LLHVTADTVDADAVEVLEVIAEIKLIEGEGDAELSVVRGEFGGADESDAELGTIWKGVISPMFFGRLRVAVFN